jgi:hypothetical protein
LNRTVVALSIAAGVQLCARAAVAEGSVVEAGAEVAGPVPVAPEPEARRPWLYADDATIPAPLRAVFVSRLTFASGAERSVTRPFASNAAAPGGLAEVGGEVGLLPTLSLDAAGIMGFGDGLAGGMVGGLRFAPLARASSSFRLVLAGGYLRDRSSENGAYAKVAASFDYHRLRLASAAHGEHVFAKGRDGVDLLVTLGASLRVAGPLRVGVEYVGQDLEEIDGDEAEGGARHFLGPTLAVDLLDHRLMLAGGPAAGLSEHSPRVVGRMSIAYAF